MPERNTIMKISFWKINKNLDNEQKCFCEGTDLFPKLRPFTKGSVVI